MPHAPVLLVLQPRGVKVLETQKQFGGCWPSAPSSMMEKASAAMHTWPEHALHPAQRKAPSCDQQLSCTHQLQACPISRRMTPLRSRWRSGSAGWRNCVTPSHLPASAPTTSQQQAWPHSSSLALLAWLMTWRCSWGSEGAAWNPARKSVGDSRASAAQERSIQCCATPRLHVGGGPLCASQSKTWHTAADERNCRPG